MKKIDAVRYTTKEFKKWVNYTEKNSKAGLGNTTYDSPGPYNMNAGSNNYTVFADYYKQKTGIAVQGMPWCDSFVDTVFIHLYGVERAKKLLNGFSAYTPTSAGYFKAVNRWFSRPEPGDIIFFKNSERINHTGYVHDVSGNTVYTVEGNTSSGNNVVVANGGCVALKSYDIHNPRIAGYGRPDYEGVLRDFNPEGFVEGWFKAADNIRWWYQFSNGMYAKNNGTNNGWYKIKNKWYLFDTNGYMLTGHQSIGGQEYYLCEDPNKVEGALMKTDENGALTIWESE